jgi:hypothetical protein
VGLFAELIGDPHAKLVATRRKNKGRFDIIGTRDDDPDRPVGIQCKNKPKEGGLTLDRAAVCTPSSLRRERRARIEVCVRLQGADDCGHDREIIACRADDTLTGLSARDCKVRAGPGAAFGAGVVRLDLLPVLVHEMGYWIGLRHIDQGRASWHPRQTARAASTRPR